MKFIVEVKIDPRWAKAVKNVRRHEVGFGTDSKGRLRSLPRSHIDDRGRTMQSRAMSPRGFAQIKGVITRASWRQHGRWYSKESKDDKATAGTVAAMHKADPRNIRKNTRVRVRGYSKPERVDTLMKARNDHVNNPSKKGPIVMYHGTTSEHQDSIAKRGISPPSKTGRKGWGGTQNHDNVYLTRSPHAAHVIAKHVAHGKNGRYHPVVYRVHVHDKSKLHRDDDFGAVTPDMARPNWGGEKRGYRRGAWFDSARHLSAVAHRGRIAAKHVSVHHVGWEPPSKKKTQ